MSSTGCEVTSLLPAWMTTACASTYILLLCLLLAVTYIKLTDKALSWKKRAIETILSVKTKKSCYFPFLTHIFDQATDIGVIVEFYYLWQKEEKHGGDVCSGVSGFFMFFLSIAAFFLYRIVSSVLIFNRTKSLFRAILQFFDLLLFHSLYINYLQKTKTPSSPQKWIQFLGMYPFFLFFYFV